MGEHLVHITGRERRVHEEANCSIDIVSPDHHRQPQQVGVMDPDELLLELYLFHSLKELPIHCLVGFPLVKLILNFSSSGIVFKIMEDRSDNCLKEEEESLDCFSVEPHWSAVVLL
jgi:hypothetical protein